MSQDSNGCCRVPPRWREMDRATLEREYSPSSAIGGNYQPFLAEYARQSQAAISRCGKIERFSYGELASNTIDIALPPSSSANGCPLLLFVHGGYWQEGSREHAMFGADVFTARGIAYGALGYTLAPTVSLSQIVVECRTAVNKLTKKAASLGIDTSRIFLAGSSAGAQLCSMCCTDDSATQPVAGVILMSGVYELEPLIQTSINDALSLTVEEAQSNSPQLSVKNSFPDAIVTWGQIEPKEFKRQGRAFANSLQEAKRSVSVFESSGRNHFDIVHDMSDTDTNLGRAILQMINNKARLPG